MPVLHPISLSAHPYILTLCLTSSLAPLHASTCAADSCLSHLHTTNALSSTCYQCSTVLQHCAAIHLQAADTYTSLHASILPVSFPIPHQDLIIASLIPTIFFAWHGSKCHCLVPYHYFCLIYIYLLLPPSCLPSSPLLFFSPHLMLLCHLLSFLLACLCCYPRVSCSSMPCALPFIYSVPATAPAIYLCHMANMPLLYLCTCGLPLVLTPPSVLLPILPHFPFAPYYHPVPAPRYAAYLHTGMRATRHRGTMPALCLYACHLPALTPAYAVACAAFACCRRPLFCRALFVALHCFPAGRLHDARHCALPHHCTTRYACRCCNTGAQRDGAVGENNRAGGRQRCVAR